MISLVFYYKSVTEERTRGQTDPLIELRGGTHLSQRGLCARRAQAAAPPPVLLTLKIVLYV